MSANSLPSQNGGAQARVNLAGEAAKAREKFIDEQADDEIVRRKASPTRRSPYARATRGRPAVSSCRYRSPSHARCCEKNGGAISIAA
jgi:hypothetical protein